MARLNGLALYNMRGLYALLRDHKHDPEAAKQITEQIGRRGTKEIFRALVFAALNRFPHYREPNAPLDWRGKIASLFVPRDWYAPFTD